MKFDFCHDLSKPLAANDTVILMIHNKGGFTAKIEPGKTIKICKDTFLLDMLIGCSYGDIFTKEAGSWIKIRRNDPQYMQYRHRVREDYNEDQSESVTNNRDINDDNTAQKLTYDQIQQLKKGRQIGPSLSSPPDKTSHEVIETIVDNSETFAKKNRMAQEKYIQRKEARHTKLFYIRPCDLYNVCDCYFNSFPHKIGFLNFANLGMMLYLADIRYGHKVMVLDHALGLITGAISQRLAGSGKIYRLVSKGVSDKIVHELGIKYFDNIFSIDVDRYIDSDGPVGQDTAVGDVHNSSADTNMDAPANTPMTNKTERTNSPNVQKVSDNSASTPKNEGGEAVSCDAEDGSQLEGLGKRTCAEEDNSDGNTQGMYISHHCQHVSDLKKKKVTLPGIYPLHNPSRDEISGCQVVIGNIAFNKCDKLNRVVAEYTRKLKAAADMYLEMGGRLVVFGQQYQPMAELQASLTLSDEYVNVKFDEMFIRQYQVRIHSQALTFTSDAAPEDAASNDAGRAPMLRVHRLRNQELEGRPPLNGHAANRKC
ncbi:eukaryotic initiation factor gamma subunit [Babesia ovata]|uniref:tRNA (adenine(58)-N(1))-methyltransferase non-catalytic subunit TRM6 n=1 Tax=Babesia ovata TaxID=189622 RepID=A0A2H6KBN6_9APIC|nr:eukaryotic initiation factor gamma subunit [Babesia ovata]GBE60401.1 eukaryotic initiation factor gamma subunit [Babesia ovata]